MLHGQTDVAALETEVQQEFERREELLKKIHEAGAGVKVEPTNKTEIIQRRIEVLTAMLAEEKLSADKSKADQIADDRAQIAIEVLEAAEARERYEIVSEPMGKARRLIEDGGPRNLAEVEDYPDILTFIRRRRRARPKRQRGTKKARSGA